MSSCSSPLDKAGLIARSTRIVLFVLKLSTSMLSLFSFNVVCVSFAIVCVEVKRAVAVTDAGSDSLAVYKQCHLSL